MADFKQAMEKVFASEGGWSDDPADSGGRTNYGITEAVAQRHGLDVKSLTRDQAEAIYYADYWTACGADRIENQRLATAVFDGAVNCGVGRAVKWLQAILSETYGIELRSDGIFGAKTADAIIAVRKYLPGIVAIYLSKRCDYYHEIIRMNPKNEKFLKGWLNRLGEL